MAPIDEIEMQDMLYSATLEDYKGPVTIRYPRGNCQGLELPEEFRKIEPGKAERLKKGSRVAVLSIGTIGNKVKEAVQKAEEEGIFPSLYNMRFLRPLDKEAVLEAATEHDHIITVEDGSVIGGLYSAVCETLADKNHNCTVTGLGIPDKFIEQGTVPQQLQECGLDAESILKAIKYFF